MLGRPFGVVWQLADTPEALKAAYQAGGDPALRRRLHALGLLRGGWALGPVGRGGGGRCRAGARRGAWSRSRWLGAGFADGVCGGLGGAPRGVGGRRGVKNRQPIQLRYEWRYLFLVVDGRAGTLHWCWLDSMAAGEILAATGGVQRAGEVGALVW